MAKTRPEIIDSVQPMMERQVVQLTRLVDELLDVSRISRGQLRLNLTELELRVVTEAAIEQCQPSLHERHHAISVDFADEPLIVRGDGQRLTQVIVNLLSNAAKYMDLGGRVSVSTRSQDGAAVLRVLDSGFGIPPERLEDVFEMFTQVPEHAVRAGGSGLGIGLALARRLMALHGGSIAAASEGLGRGSEFTIRLPLLRREEALRAPASRARAHAIEA
jgi:signal transduction histidine kinase